MVARQISIFNALQFQNSLRTSILLLVPLVFAHGYAAGSEANLRERIVFCANHADDTDRLRCFNTLSFDVDAHSPTSNQKSDWITWSLYQQISPIDSNLTVNIHIDATKKLYKIDSLPQLWIWCDQDVTSIYFDYNYTLFNEGDYIWNIGVRIDDGDLEWWELKVSSTQDSVGLWDGRSSIPFIRKLISANRLLVALSPEGLGEQISIFPLNGLHNAISPIQSACHWR